MSKTATVPTVTEAEAALQDAQRRLAELEKQLDAGEPVDHHEFVAASFEVRQAQGLVAKAEREGAQAAHEARLKPEGDLTDHERAMRDLLAAMSKGVPVHVIHADADLSFKPVEPVIYTWQDGEAEVAIERTKPRHQDGYLAATVQVRSFAAMVNPIAATNSVGSGGIHGKVVSDRFRNLTQRIDVAEIERAGAGGQYRVKILPEAPHALDSAIVVRHGVENIAGHPQAYARRIGHPSYSARLALYGSGGLKIGAELQNWDVTDSQPDKDGIFARTLTFTTNVWPVAGRVGMGDVAKRTAEILDGLVGTGLVGVGRIVKVDHTIRQMNDVRAWIVSVELTLAARKLPADG